MNLDYPHWIVRRAPWFLLAIHLPILVLGPVTVLSGDDDTPSAGIVVLAVSSGALLTFLHLRHVFAAAQGRRPAGWPITLTAQALVAVVPIIWLFEYWTAPMLSLGAAAMALLPTRWGRALAFTVLMVAFLVIEWAAVRTLGPTEQIVNYVYTVGISAVFMLALYGTVRLIRLLNELHETRTELARSAVARERVRLSRDLHDLLGQSLSAISLKGDLAVRLLPIDTAAAHAEIAGVAQAARAALHDMNAVTRGEHAVVLGDEVTAAAALLAAAGVHTEVIGTATPHPVLAWAVREGTTNLLRHSDATRCVLALGPGSVEMTNDGVRSPRSPDGSGITGLRARAAAVGGTVSVTAGDDEFVLRVTVPAEGET
ncbi:sensor histidine kinase [Amycolatopsis minnesotensis]|uniref:Signal transduction histidine kinase subgroup 3 dimerisation and phosphoacceptor domain-containing protein n=1 Tax=Amycolatopsis minnesotensis TaxID=337894 RepID=A0ABN2SRQ9_9PSEU